MIIIILINICPHPLHGISTIVVVLAPIHVRHHVNPNEHVQTQSKESSSFESVELMSLCSSMNRRDSAASRLKETEKRERRRKGLPPLKEDHLVGSFNGLKKVHRYFFTFCCFSSQFKNSLAWSFT